jgi:hypothetical protein
MTRVRFPRTLICLTMVAAGLAPVIADDSAKSPSVEPYPSEMKPFADKMLDVAKKYEQYGRIDDELRWAPGLCRAPIAGGVKFSDSKDDTTHGRKLYSLFAGNRDAYFFLGQKKTAPIGQVIVKESWVPEETKAPESARPQSKTHKVKSAPGGEVTDHFFPYVLKDGKWYKASRRAGLYVMMKYDPKTAGTDEGWVYGTVSADLKQVTSIGKVASCMECHTKAKFDRQFWFNTDKK